jgi:hypothetical protein
VETLAPDEDASVTIRGTAEAPILDFGLPKGETGDKGDKGETGEVSLADLASLMPLETVSGSVASFSDGSAVFDAEQALVTLEPVQDLHGYDKPWSGGAGKNLFDASAALVGYYIDNTNGNLVTGGDDSVASDYIEIKAGQTYRISPTLSSGNWGAWYDSDKVYISGITYYSTAKTAPSNAKYMRFTVSRNGSNLNYATTTQVEEGSTATAWTPYSNICPISGRTEVVTQRTGKNLLPKYAEGTTRTQNGITGTANADGSITYSGTSTGTFWGLGNSPTILVKAGTYTLSARNNTDIAINLVNADTGAYIDGVTGSNSKAITFANDTKVYYYTTIGSGKTVDTTATYQLELGTTATDYEPYQGNTYTTDLGRTVYGGTVDLVSGVLTVDRAIIQDLSALPWTYVSNTYFKSSYALTDGKVVSNATPMDMVCSAYGVVAGRDIANGSAANCTIGTEDTTPPTLRLKNTNYTDVSALTSALNGVQVCYKLATPQTYQLTHQAIALLTGDNNVWSADGQIQVKYRANIGLYVDKKISEVNA